MSDWFEAEVRQLEQHPLPSPNTAIAFYGSSSIRLWQTLERDFAGHTVANRGFGGSTLHECLRCFDRLVTPLNPRAVLVYAGDNDLAQGASPEQIHSDVRSLAERLAHQLPGTPWAFVSIKPSPARQALVGAARRANELIESELSDTAHSTFIDVLSEMLDHHGSPRRELYSDDWLHMNPDGYRLWQGLIEPWVDQVDPIVDDASIPA
ncbi:MAG: GDSL-type esterase/lipase family protein [Azospirillaceae bacterium]|nr:GDSL-type esterase/lipase family protein [Azospirillaceae bacterium]